MEIEKVVIDDAERLDFHRPITKDELSFAFELITGAPPANDAELSSAAHIANTFPNSRLELFRYITQRADYWEKSRDISAILFDQVIRSRVFADFKIPKVNLFCVGAPRCGTTTLSTMLGQNRHVYSSPIKETNFFSHMWNGAAPGGVPLEMYDLFYTGWRGEKILTDFSPVYLMHRHAMRGVAAYNPNAKIIICLRDPVERAISAFFYTRPYHRSNSALDYYSPVLRQWSLELHADEKWYSPSSLLRQSFYSEDLRYVYSLFENVLIVNFWEFADLPALNKKVCSFVGVDVDSIKHALEGRNINSSKKDKNDELFRAEETLAGFFAEEKARLSSEFNIVF
jgi:hypothetical protein